MSEKIREIFENEADKLGYCTQRHEEDMDSSRYLEKKTNEAWNWFCEGYVAGSTRPAVKDDKLTKFIESARQAIEAGERYLSTIQSHKQGEK